MRSLVIKKYLALVVFVCSLAALCVASARAFPDGDVTLGQLPGLGIAIALASLSFLYYRKMSRSLACPSPISRLHKKG